MKNVLEIEEKFKTLTESKKIPLQSVLFHLWVRASSPYCSHLGLFDSGLSFRVKEIHCASLRCHCLLSLSSGKHSSKRVAR